MKPATSQNLRIGSAKIPTEWAGGGRRRGGGEERRQLNGLNPCFAFRRPGLHP